HCARAELIPRGMCDDVLGALPVRSGSQPPAGRELSDAELVALQRAAIQHPNPVLALRNAAVVAVFQSTGCRISEVSDLDLADYRQDDDSLQVRVTKSGRPIRVWLVPWAALKVESWLFVRGAEPGPLFLSCRGGRLGTDGIRDLLT